MPRVFQVTLEITKKQVIELPDVVPDNEVEDALLARIDIGDGASFLEDWWYVEERS